MEGEDGALRQLAVFSLQLAVKSMLMIFECELIEPTACCKLVKQTANCQLQTAKKPYL